MWPFDQNNQQMYQQYASYTDQGSYGQIPEQEARQNYQQFVQNAPPQMVEQAHAQYYQQMPQEQHASLVQRGVNPGQAGIQHMDLSTMSPQEGARLTSFAQQQQPGLLLQVMGPGGPLGSTGAKMAVAGVVAFAAKQMLGGWWPGWHEGVMLGALLHQKSYQSARKPLRRSDKKKRTRALHLPQAR